ncbi:2-C-methyl-D-erythritol 4-phosphate cytidylyltransferase [Natranaerofaba carboxydovora]|uniref:2-C-methyl-D-erythritol 4-phosphate cytidylyltransferase n=1 Tax=Natranaerofaba carboxydovora TaxID=2742683 RepID=UPI001F13A73E|nr:2-C-methyl-D-erythritol 4-phosphate cytidylyltransferase [Natranaerofaba carboxydovora]UMZ75369.1 2-C-methyl-D-erythritol 4-phosphate cytidylyltransferase [Natranaerofaba carboxydovora]
MDKLNYNVSCIIPAAGQGKRMGTKVNKQYLNLLGKPVLTHTWRAFTRLSFIKEIILVVNKDEKPVCYDEVIKPYNDEINNNKDIIIKAIEGGKSRQQSVYNGIKEASSECSYIMIHDGARPLVTADLIEKVIAEAYIHFAALAAVPVKDTVKVSYENDTGVFVKETPPRETLWSAQTPQAFEKSLIEKAHEKAVKKDYTGFDDCSLVERIGVSPRVVKSSYENIKLTTIEDVELAEKILERRGRFCE